MDGNREMWTGSLGWYGGKSGTRETERRRLAVERWLNENMAFAEDLDAWDRKLSEGSPYAFPLDTDFIRFMLPHYGIDELGMPFPISHLLLYRECGNDW